MCNCERQIAALQGQVNGLERIVKELRFQVKALTPHGVKAHVRDSKLFMECLEEVARITGVSCDIILSDDRRAAASWARQRLMALCHDRGMDGADIARAMGRDHSTVFYGIQRHKARQK